LNDTEEATVVSLRGRVLDLDKQLKLMTVDYSLDEETASNIKKWTGQPVATQEGHAWRTVGDALWDYLHKDTDRDARARIADFEAIASRASSASGKSSESYIHLRAAQHMGTTAAATTPTAGGFGGLIVSPVAGPIIDIGYYGTPVLSVLGVQDAPNPFSFVRPRIIDPHINDGAGPQAGGLEKGELPSYKFDVNSESVSMKLVGGYLNVSQQVISWLPGGLDIIIRQLTRRAQRAAELAATAELAKSTVLIPLADAATSAEVLKALGDAAAAVFTATGAMPTWLVVGPAGWSRLFSLVDAAGRPLFPSLNPANALGSRQLDNLAGTTAGLPTAVSPGVTDQDMFMGNGDSIELYRSNLPVLEAVEPSVLGRQVAVAVGLGAYQPITNETGPVRGGVVKIGD
jgi:hypothetical protein